MDGNGSCLKGKPVFAIIQSGKMTISCLDIMSVKKVLLMLLKFRREAMLLHVGMNI